MIWDTCVLDKFTKFIYLQDNFIELSQPHVTYQKASNIVVRCADYWFVKVYIQKSFANNPVRLFLTFSKNLQQNQQIWNKQQIAFRFYFLNWKHHKNNIALPTPTKKRVPEIDITQLQQEQEQQQQNNLQKEEILEAGKRPESYEKRVAYPFEQKPEKNNEVVTPLLPPPPPAVSATPSNCSI